MNSVYGREVEHATFTLQQLVTSMAQEAETFYKRLASLFAAHFPPNIQTGHTIASSASPAA